jgi:hypothetical protein
MWRCHTSNQIHKAKKERTQLPKEKEQNITDWATWFSLKKRGRVRYGNSVGFKFIQIT